jgi:Ca-activated chloride channel homolog
LAVARQGRRRGAVSKCIADRGLPPAARAVPTFTVKFGSADPTALTAVSELTGGKLFVVRGNGLAGAFEEIRAYQ